MTETQASPTPNEAPKRRAAQVQPFVASQLEEVLTLYGTVFGVEAARAFRARYRWSQEENDLPDQTPRWVLSDESKIVGFLATIPQRFRVAGRDVLVHYSCDYMVHPDYRFYGISLMREYFRACENCVSLDDVPATIAVLKMMKMAPVGEAQRYVRMLDARAAKTRVAKLARVPEPAFAPATWLLRGYDAARARLQGPRVTELADFDTRFDAFFLRTQGSGSVSLVRDARYLTWRYGPTSPHRNRTIGVVEKNSGEIAGYVVCNASTNPADRTGYVFELHGEPGASKDVFASLLTFACRHLRRKGSHLGRLHFIAGADAIPEQALGEGRFVKRTHQHVLLAKFRDPELQKVATDPAAWTYSFGDSEASHGVGI